MEKNRLSINYDPLLPFWVSLMETPVYVNHGQPETAEPLSSRNMHPILVKKYVAITALLFAIVASAQQRGEQEAIASALTKYFGNPTAVEPLRYKFTPTYTVGPLFSPDGALAKICVEPKERGFFYLSQSEYDEALRLLNLVKPLGAHKEDGPGIVHGGRSWTQQQFENGYIFIGEYFARPSAERRIARVCVYYLRPVTGIVRFRASATPSPFGLICIDNQAYNTPTEERAKLRHSDAPQTVTVAGPMEDDCRNVADPDR